MAGELITGPEQVSAAWLTSALGRAVEDFEVEPGHGNWSRQLAIRATLQGGDVLALRLKLCAGNTFGRSEVDYYLRDYIDLPGAPLVRCFEGRHEPGLGYHLLLEDLSATHADRRDAAPTLAYGLAVAEALGRLHRHRWGCEPPPAVAKLDRYFDEIRPGLLPMEAATGHALRSGFAQLERNMRERWADPQGMALLHGDLNPTNVLTPRGAEAPVLFIDRQPFDWSLTYGLAVSDLAYFMIPWWPEDTRRECEEPVLRRWHEALERHDYPWALAQADWRLSVAQCMNVPMEWCSKPETLERMRWLWQAQYGRIRSAMQDGA